MKLHQLYIPQVGDSLTLAHDWTFGTICEHRNESLFNAYDIPPEQRWKKAVEGRSGGRWVGVGLPLEHIGFDCWRPLDEPTTFTLPAGTILKVDRIYIRKGAGDYSSLTFLITDSSDKRVVTKKKGGSAPKAVRFWVHLDHANKIEFTTDE